MAGKLHTLDEGSVPGLEALLVDELRDLLDAERQLTKTLPKLAKAATSDELREAFDSHLRETNGHVDRLTRVFDRLGVAAKAKRCAGIRGIIEEGGELMDEAEEPVMDAALVAAAQKAEHYEIASYGSAATHADVLGKPDIAEMLRQTLSEEKAADKKLTHIALEFANERARRSTS